MWKLTTNDVDTRDPIGSKNVKPESSQVPVHNNAIQQVTSGLSESSPMAISISQTLGTTLKMSNYSL